MKRMTKIREIQKQSKMKKLKNEILTKEETFEIIRKIIVQIKAIFQCHVENF